MIQTSKEQRGQVYVPAVNTLLFVAVSGRIGDWCFDPASAVYFLPRDEIVQDDLRDTMPRWQEMLFGFMSFHCASSAEYYGLDSEEVVELGVQMAL